MNNLSNTISTANISMFSKFHGHSHAYQTGLEGAMGGLHAVLSCALSWRTKTTPTYVVTGCNIASVKTVMCCPLSYGDTRGPLDAVPVRRATLGISGVAASQREPVGMVSRTPAMPALSASSTERAKLSVR